MKYLQRLCSAYWVGSMLYFSFLFAPRVFRVLERNDAARLQNALFPSYFLSLSLCAGICALFALKNKNKLGGMLCGLSFVAFLFGDFYLTPQIRFLFESQAPKEVFAHLHRLSMGLNFLTLLVGLWTLRSTSLNRGLDY